MRRGLIAVPLLLALLFLAGSPSWSAQSRVDGMDYESPVPSKSRSDRPIGQRPMTDAMHNEFMANEEYALADGLLNAAWSMAKKSLSKEEYLDLRDSQRAWVNGRRDAEASRLLEDMGPAQAYAQVTRKRAEEIARILSSRPKEGHYTFNDEGFKASFNARIEGNELFLDGESFNLIRGNTCGFDGQGRIKSGWIRMTHEDMPDFYVLFTRSGARIYYASSEIAQGCGVATGFADTYSYAGR